MKIKLTTLLIVLVLLVICGLGAYFLLKDKDIGVMKSTKNDNGIGIFENNTPVKNEITDNNQNPLNSSNYANTINNNSIKDTEISNVTKNFFINLTNDVEKNLIGTYAFEAKYSSNEDGRKADIYALKTDGTEIKIAEKVNPGNIWYDSGKLYFSTIYDHFNPSYSTFSYTTIDLTNSSFNMNTFQLNDVDITNVAGSVEDTIYYSSSFPMEQNATSLKYYIGAYSMKDKTNKVLYTSENVIYNTSISQDKTSIYFIEGTFDEEPNGHLYYYNIKTGTIKKISDFKVPRLGFSPNHSCELIGDNLIYQENDNCIIVYNLVTNKKETLIEDTTHIYDFLINNNEIYYTTVLNGKCNIIKYDGTNKEIIYTKNVQDEYYLDLDYCDTDKIIIGETNGYYYKDGWYKIINLDGKQLNEEVQPYQRYLIGINN